MLFRRARRWSTAALLAGAVLVSGSLVSPVEAVTARTVSFRANTSSALTGAQITVAGKVSKAPTGSYVYIQKFDGRLWLITTLARTSDSLGNFRARVTLPKEPGTYAYRAYVPQTGSLGEATSGTVRVAALRKVYTSLKASSATVSLGKPAKLLGKVTPFLAGTTVTLQRYSGIGWSTVTTKRLSSTGTFTHSFYPKATLSYRFKVPRTGLRAAATSGGVRITVTGGEAPPTITTSSLPAANLGAPYSQTLTKTGGTGTWSLLSGKLPAGLVLKSVSGVIAGTPTTAGTSAFQVAFTAASGPAAAKSLSLAVVTGPAITTPSLPAGSRGTPYSTTLSKSGKAGAWSVTGGSLPPGIGLDGATGAVAGTPTVDGTFPVTVTYTETASGLTATKAFQLVIVDPPDPVITTTTVPGAVVGQDYSPVTVQKTGNAGTWTLTSGTLPSGMTFSSTGVLAGKPTADAETTDDFFVEVTFTEANGTTDSQTLLLHVSTKDDPVITGTVPAGKVGVDYEGGDFNAAPNPIGSQWSISFGALPPGLTLNGSNGNVLGTPTTAGDYTFIVRYRTFYNADNTRIFTLHVDPA